MEPSPTAEAQRLMLPWRLEIDTRASLLSDVNEHPTQLAAAGTAHLNYRFAQGPRFDFRTGIGPRVFMGTGPLIGRAAVATSVAFFTSASM